MSAGPEAGFDPVFQALRRIMLAHAEGLTVAKDAPGDLVVRLPGIDPKTKAPGWFGTVTVKRSYVAYHLIGLYTQPGPAEAISPALAKRRQGKTCFNFKRVDEDLFAELDRLTQEVRAGAGA
jgi:hypothetical protein